MITSFRKKFRRHFRQASWLYSIGVACFLLWSLFFLCLCCLPHETSGEILDWASWFPLLLVFGMALFWGTIFGHRKSNDSSHVSDGKIWWSRMLPAMILYIPIYICSICFLFVFAAGEGVFDDQDWGSGLLIYFVLWLTPLVMGAFFSIAFRSQIAAFFLTCAGVVLLTNWNGCLSSWFGCSPTSTTLPICIALLVASRFRAKDYLRGTYTWRGKLIPLIPVFGIMLAVLAALPFVRYYSVPYISWEQIETYFDQTDVPERLALDKRKALIQFIAENNALPPGHDEFYALFRPRIDVPAESEYDFLKKYTYEEYLLLYYALEEAW
jgi:hypothetical protein